MHMIGIGTGRCGTMSLAQLISGCSDCIVHHELGAPAEALAWTFDEPSAERRLADLLAMRGIVVGDVGFYYLNYVDFFAARLPELRIVHVYRRVDDVVRSLLQKTGERNHWMASDAAAEPDPKWDRCFPKYEYAANKTAAIRRYYRDYIIGAAELTRRHADKILHVNVAHLNNRHQQELLFDFLGIPLEIRRIQNIIANTSVKPNPHRYDDHTSRIAISEIGTFVSSDAPLILIDENLFRWSPEFKAKVLPFLERNGEDWGPPTDDAMAVRELERLRRLGASFIAFAWPAYWWLNYYVGFAQYLQSNFGCVLKNDRVTVFDLRQPTLSRL